MPRWGVRRMQATAASDGLKEVLRRGTQRRQADQGGHGQGRRAMLLLMAASSFIHWSRKRQERKQRAREHLAAEGAHGEQGTWGQQARYKRIK